MAYYLFNVICWRNPGKWCVSPDGVDLELKMGYLDMCVGLPVVVPFKSMLTSVILVVDHLLTYWSVLAYMHSEAQ